MQRPATKVRAAGSSPSDVVATLGFLTDKQLDQVVTLLNAILDLASFSDDEEQEIFLHAVKAVVTAIERALPATFLNLCHSDHEEEGLDPAEAKALGARLGDAVRSSISLPYFAKKQEWQVVQCVVDLVCRGMGRDTSFDHVLQIEQAGPVVMECFVKGNAGAFFHEVSQSMCTVHGSVVS